MENSKLKVESEEVNCTPKNGHSVKCKSGQNPAK